MEKWVAIIANLVAIMIAIVGGFFWLKGEVHEQIDNRLKPYDDYLLGLSDLHNDEPGKAVPKLAASFIQFMKKSPDVEIPDAAIDYYLLSITEAGFQENIHSFKPDFNRIKDYVVKSGKSDGLALQSFA
jgi:hypothetical protein